MYLVVINMSLMVLFCGLSAFNMVSEVMSRSTNLIASNTNYVKKGYFSIGIVACGGYFFLLCLIKLVISF